MLASWWRRLLVKRMTRPFCTGRTRLGAEALEPRDVPAGIFVTAAAAGSPPVVAVFNASTRQQLFTINAFEASFTGGVNVAVGDVNGDGTPDVITGAGVGGGAAVNVFNGADGTLLKTFTVGDDASRGGVGVAAADFDGDGRVEVVAGGILNGQSVVQILRFSDGTAVQTFTPFANVRAVSVAAGDFNGDGTPDVAAGAGPGGAPAVAVFDAKTGGTLLSQMVFETTFTGGVTVAMADLNSDSKADVIVSARTLGGPRVTVLAGGTGAIQQNFFADTETIRTGVQAVAFDADANGKADVVTVSAAGLKAFNGTTLAALTAPTTPGLPVAAMYDTTAPAPTVTATGQNPTKTSPLPFRVTFGEAANGFSAAGVTVTNGTAANFVAVDARTYTFDVTPTAAVTVTVAVKAAAAFDAAGNGNTAASGTATFDTTGPAITIAALTTNDTTPTITGTVDDPAATVAVTVNGQTVNATVASNGNYSATLTTALTPGTYTITATATDKLGNTSNATSANGLVIDTTAPTPTVSSTAPEPTKSSPIPFTVTFDQDVTGFTTGDVTVTNGTVGNFTPVDAKTYTFNAFANGQGAVSASVAAGVATDAAGNGNLASNTLTRTLDTTAPSITANSLTTSDTTPTLTGTVSDATATVSVTVAGNTRAATVTGTTWSVTIPSPLANGQYTVDATASDPAGNANSTTLVAGLVIDTTAPAVTLTTAAPNPTNLSKFSVKIEFREPVTGFDVSELTVNNGQASNLQTQDNRAFTADVTPRADGPVSVSVPPNVAQDQVGLGNTASNTVAITSDRTAPTATFTSDPASPTGAGTVRVTVRFSEPVTGLTLADDVTVDRGTASNLTGTGADYAFDVAPTADGTVTMTLKTSAVQDASANANAQTVFTFTSDRTAPTGAITGASTGPITGTADDATAGVQKVEITISNGTNFWTGSAFASPTPVPLTATSTNGFATWSYDFTGPDGTYRVTAAVTDKAGNTFGATPTDVTVLRGP